jgi:hypothetical protein
MGKESTAALKSAGEKAGVQETLESIRSEVRQELSALRYQIECVARDLEWLERRLTSTRRA